MKKLLIILGLLAIPVFAFAAAFNSAQVGSNPVNTYFLQTNGSISTWAAVSAGSSFPFTVQSWGVSTTTTLGFFNGFLSNASSTINANLLINGNSTTTNATTTGQIAVTGTGANYFAGNVGVGTQSPNYTGFSGNVVTAASSAASGGAFESANTHASAAGLLMDGLSFVQTGNTSANDLRIGMIAGITQGSTPNYYGGGIRLFTRAEGGALTQRWIVNDDGTFCINETTCTGGVFGVSGGANFDNSTTTSATTTSEYDTTLNALNASSSSLIVGGLVQASSTAFTISSTSPQQGALIAINQPKVGQGTITVNAGSGTVTGTGTTFSKDFTNGFTINANGESHNISALNASTPDTVMTTDNWTNNYTGTYTITNNLTNQTNWTMDDRGDLGFGNSPFPINRAFITPISLSPSFTCTMFSGAGSNCGFRGVQMTGTFIGTTDAGITYSAIQISPTYNDTSANSVFSVVTAKPTLNQTINPNNNTGSMFDDEWTFGANNTQNWAQMDGAINGQTITSGSKGTFSTNDMNQAYVHNNTSGTATDTEATYFHGTGMTSSFAGGITNAAGVELDNINATNYAYLDLTSAANTIPTGQFGIWENTGQSNAFLDKVGIGTTTPVVMLDVRNNTTYTSGGTYAIYAANASQSQSKLMLGFDSSLEAGVIQSTQTGVGFMPTIISPNGIGNVGVATTTPWKMFSVNGNVSFAGLNTAGITDSALCLTANNEVVYNSGVATCTVSSERYKHDITKLDPTDSLNAVLALTPSAFEYNQTNQKAQGLIAEQVLKVLPEAVDYNNQGQVQSVDYTQIDANLIGAVQAMQKEIDNIKVPQAAKDTRVDWLAGAFLLYIIYNEWDKRRP